MTPTTASPSLLLLNPATPTAKSAVAGDAEAAPDAPLSGFQLLLGTLQQLPTSTTNTAAAASKNSEKNNADSGNALPLLGSILPLTASPQAASDTTAQADTKKSKDEKDQDVNSAATALMLPVVALPAAPTGSIIRQPSLSADTTATAVSADAMASTSALAEKDAALMARSRLIRDTKADSTDNKTTVLIQAAGVSSIATTDAAKTVAPTDTSSMAAAANAMASMLTGGTNSADTNVGVKAAGPIPTTGANSVDAAVGVNADITATAAAFVKEVQGASKHLVESDFDALVKHFDASNTQATPSAVTIGNSANTHQASGNYANAASSNASVSVPVGSNGWSDAVADKVMWFSANKISSAEIHLNPPDLGPLQVRVSTQHDQASVVFTSQHAAVRDALDQALPRLREMMGSQGMHLLDVSVGGQSAQQQQQQFARSNSDRGAASGDFFADDSTQAAVATVTTVNTARLIRSGVDAYA